MLNSSIPNYSGRQPDVMQNVKQFVSSTTGVALWFYKTISNSVYITPADQTKNVLIPKDLYVVGSITNTSDIREKENISCLTKEEISNLMYINPQKYNFIKDKTKKNHYGVMAQELEIYFPDLVTTIQGEAEDTKSVNYIELIPILLSKIQHMQSEIDEMKKHIDLR
jgi:hypothetical protein